MTPVGRIWVIKSTVAFCPLFVPGTCAIRDEIISAWRFSDPKDGCYDICFPRIAPYGSGGGRFFDEGRGFFSCRLDLRAKSWIKCDEKRATKKAK
jgi:hypothetical protein